MAYEQNWYTVTVSADRRWEEALQRYWEALHKWRGHTRHVEQAEHDISWARAEYRNFVLGWYRKLLLPMQVGDCVPNRVAELLAEEWDEATKGAQ